MTPFFYHPRMLAYDFGKNHPLKPERLKRTIELVELHTNLEILDPGLCSEKALLTIHSEDYVAFIRDRSHSENQVRDALSHKFGFGYGDCPYFANAHEASLAYCSGSLEAAKSVNNGHHRAINISGGLHHAQASKASGFCIYNDIAIAIFELKKRFQKIAYVDIDVHHGDGVQDLFWDDPNVLTCSIHQDGQTLYPGTGFVQDIPESKTVINVSLLPDSTADVWEFAFNKGILRALEIFQPEVLVVQTGTDAHLWDPLARLRLRTQDWLAGIQKLSNLDLPTVIVGGGGYHLECVPRMWLGSICIWTGTNLPIHLGAKSDLEWNMPTIFDTFEPDPYSAGKLHVKTQVIFIEDQILPFLAT